MTLPPQVIRHNDGSFHILNVDINSLSRTQRVGLAIRVWEQVRALLEANGEYRARDTSVPFRPTGVGSFNLIDKVAAKAAHTDWSAVNKVRPRLIQQPDLLAKVESGEIGSINEVARALGMLVMDRLDEGRPSNAKRTASYYGKGDKFDAALEPMRRYLRAWRKKDFRFTHVNPKEAKRRIKMMDEVIDNLSKAREDLARRSHVATLTAPPGKTRRENS